MAAKTLILAVILVVLQSAAAKRDPRLFFVTTSTTTSTTSTTSTLSTTTICWTSGTSALTASCGRKRRHILTDPITLEGEETVMEPFRASRSVENSPAAISSGVSNKSSDRVGKFFWYYMTTTSTSTSTSTTTSTTFTGTQIISVGCTPSGFNSCG